MLWIHGMVFVLLLLMLLPEIRRKVRKKLELAAPPEVLTGALIILLAGNILGTAVTVLDLAGNSRKLTQVEQETQEGQEQTVTLETRKGDGSRREVPGRQKQTKGSYPGRKPVAESREHKAESYFRFFGSSH